MNLLKAVHFIERSNDRVLTELAYFLTGNSSKDKVLNTIIEYQLPDGGWTKTDKDYQGNVSIISTTWVGLAWLIWTGTLHTIHGNRTIKFIKNTQTREGYWDEPRKILEFNPLPWMKPGNYDNQLWLTSALCCKLKQAGLESEVEYNKAISFLINGWNGERFPVYIHTHWMCLYIFSGLKTPVEKQIFLGCKNFLINSIKENKTDPGDYAAIAYNSCLSGKPAKDLFELSYKRLNTFQQPDGGMLTHYGDKHRPSLTVDALAVQKLLGEM